MKTQKKKHRMTWKKPFRKILGLPTPKEKWEPLPNYSSGKIEETEAVSLKQEVLKELGLPQPLPSVLVGDCIEDAIDLAIQKTRDSIFSKEAEKGDGLTDGKYWDGEKWWIVLPFEEYKKNVEQGLKWQEGRGNQQGFSQAIREVFDEIEKAEHVGISTYYPIVRMKRLVHDEKGNTKRVTTFIRDNNRKQQYKCKKGYVRMIDIRNLKKKFGVEVI